ncbi:MAG TPA: hypothetical protein VK034_04530, partial [Enhygromyxa sp.]|nr:hypothetical protein [Enhygromyxa sp.]
MVELDEQIRQELAGLRAREGPSAAIEQRMLARLELELGDSGPDDPGDLGGEPSHVSPEPAALGSGSKLVFAAKVVA